MKMTRTQINQYLGAIVETLDEKMYGVTFAPGACPESHVTLALEQGGCEDPGFIVRLALAGGLLTREDGPCLRITSLGREVAEKCRAERMNENLAKVLSGKPVTLKCPECGREQEDGHLDCVCGEHNFVA